MDGVREFLDDVKRRGLARENLLGLLNVLIGRRVARANGAALSNGQTWREAAHWLKKIRWDKKAAADLGLDPKGLPPRDRERFWYAVIARAGVDSPEGIRAGDRLADELRKAGYVVSPSPNG